jgi:hypothetical protein
MGLKGSENGKFGIGSYLHCGPPYRYEIREGGVVIKTSDENYGTTGDAMRAGIAEKVRIMKEREHGSNE